LHNLFLKPEKCEFKRTCTTFLGMVISENRVSMAPSKV
jgi:hypothetical protein